MKTTRSIRVFQTETQYNNVKNTFVYPTVSYVRGSDTVHYMTLREKYAREYLTFEALENGTFTLTIDKDSYGITLDITSVSYSLDNGNTWITETRNPNAETIITTPSIAAGDKVLWKGIGTKYGASGPGKGIRSIFSSDCKFIAYGNIHSLTFGDDFINNFTTYQNNYYGLFGGSFLTSARNLILPATALAWDCYNNMFNGCTLLKTAPELPATTLAQNCYNGMFKDCTSLTTAPVLPATTLASYCYNNMFYDCTSLTTAPVLPATTLASNCYFCMFNGCTSLTTAPELPATALAQYCYYYMFSNCTSLTTAPVLPATTLASNCYYGMFDGCTRLNYIKAMFTTTPSTSYTNNWVSGVASTGTFVKNNAATWNVTGVNGIPSGWTVQTAAS